MKEKPIDELFGKTEKESVPIIIRNVNPEENNYEGEELLHGILHAIMEDKAEKNELTFDDLLKSGLFDTDVCEDEDEDEECKACRGSDTRECDVRDMCDGCDYSEEDDEYDYSDDEFEEKCAITGTMTITIEQTGFGTYVTVDNCGVDFSKAIAAIEGVKLDLVKRSVD